jgi:hypothetical protein
MSTVEDNQAVRILATTDPPRMTPGSKHIAVSYHWFRSHLSDLVKIVAVPSEDQLTDILIKPLMHIKFRKARKQVLRW